MAIIAKTQWKEISHGNQRRQVTSNESIQETLIMADWNVCQRTNRSWSSKYLGDGLTIDVYCTKENKMRMISENS